MSKSSRNLGIWGENEAGKYLIKKGYSILERNIRTSHGEIDIVALLDGLVIFVEVKTRQTENYGLPEESINSSKTERLIQSSEAYMQAHPEFDQGCRIDVISIQKDNIMPIQIIHFENAIDDNA